MPSMECDDSSYFTQVGSTQRSKENSYSKFLMSLIHLLQINIQLSKKKRETIKKHLTENDLFLAVWFTVHAYGWVLDLPRSNFVFEKATIAQ